MARACTGANAWRRQQLVDRRRRAVIELNWATGVRDTSAADTARRQIADLDKMIAKLDG